MPAATEPLLDAAAVRELESLSLAGTEAIVSGFGGRRAGRGRSRGLDFVDYRRYTPGDDLRDIDWNVYRRLRELVVKASPGEGHVDLALLLDGSRSMDEGTPSRFRYAQRLAAALGTVALRGADVVAVGVLADGEAWAGSELTAPHLVAALLAEVGRLPRGTRTDLAASLRAHRRRSPDADLAVLISDALVAPEDLGEALTELRASAGAAALVHLVEGAGAALPRGPVELRDRETGERLVVEVTDALAAEYEAEAEALAGAVRRGCEDCGITYLRAPSTTAPLDLLFGAAREAELVSR